MIKKLIILITFTLLSLYVQAQKKYVVLDSAYNPQLNYTHIVSEYHGFPIETFNIFLDEHKTTIALLSVLKPFDEKGITWNEIDLDSVKNDIVTVKNIAGMKKSKYSAYYPVLRKNGRYFVPVFKSYLNSLEIFYTVDYTKDKSLFYRSILHTLNPYNKIDLNAQIESISNFEQQHLKKFGRYSDNYQPSGFAFYLDDEKQPCFNFLVRGADTIINQLRAFRFWTLGGWPNDTDGWERGIDRFTYVPEYGIVAGGYKPYFTDVAHLKTLTVKSPKEEREARLLALMHHSKIKNIQLDTLRIKRTSYYNPVKPHINYDYLHDIQSTPLKIEVNGKIVYEKKRK